jgi:ADP-ribose pyrophosphatase YjhB (NUDIX family)
MRQVAAAFAWIERVTPAGPQILAQWNRKWQAFNLIGGHVEVGETCRECVVREMIEELDIAADQFRVEPDPLTRIEFEAFSVPAQEMTAYQMAVFRASVRGKGTLRKIDESSENRWLSPVELGSGTTDDGRKISEVAARFNAAIIEGRMATSKARNE